MRILIHDYIAYPFVVQLARALAQRGHDVLFLYGGGVRAPRAATERRPTDPASLRIERVALNEALRPRAGPQRLLQERRYARQLAAQIQAHQPDVVLSTQSSLDGQAAAMTAASGANAAFVYWLQDIYSQAIERIIGRRLPIAGRLAAARFARLEARLLRESDAVVSIADDFAPILERWGVPKDRVHVIPNWAPLDEVRPMPKSNAWSQELALDKTKTFLYSGTLGRKHDPSLLIALADAFPDATTVVVSDGAGTDRLRELAAGRSNLVLLPLQPIERLPEVLASADVLVALLEPDANVFSVPSKVLTYLTAGRPILAAIPAANQAAHTIRDAGAGVVVEPTDRSGFVESARKLIDQGSAGMGDAGRAYAEQAFDIEAITDRFERLMTHR